MPKSTKRKKKRTPQAAEFLLALETAKTGGSTLRHEKHLSEWRFIDKHKYDCRPGEKCYLLEYELAREAEAQGLAYRSAATWEAVFGSRFPDTPFLSVQAVERAALLKAAFSEGNTGAPLFDFTTEWQGISYQSTYALRPAYQAELEAMVTEAHTAANIEAGEHNADEAISNFMGNLPAEAYDQSVAHVRMTINFDYSDGTLSDAFAALLGSLRCRNAVPGRKDEVDAHLKQLAATRLYRIFGTVQAVQDYLTDCDFDLPYEGDAGWSKARAAVRKLLAADVTKQSR